MLRRLGEIKGPQRVEVKRKRPLYRVGEVVRIDASRAMNVDLTVIDIQRDSGGKVWIYHLSDKGPRGRLCVMTGEHNLMPAGFYDAPKEPVRPC